MKITNDAEYESVKRVLALVKEEEPKLQTPEGKSLVGDMRAQLQAAVDQCEAAKREDTI